MAHNRDLICGTYTAIDHTVDLVATYVRANAVPAADLPGLIASVHAAIAGLGQPAAVEEQVAQPTAAEIRKSITPDAIVSFIDGRPYKSMKRHLTAHGLTPDSYRVRFGLAADYPMVAPSYSAQRSALAKQAGLGGRPQLQAVA